jgi:hypothetical protein
MPELHALLVGIDHYQPKRLPDGCLISDLHGCVRDVERMEEFLRAEPLAIPAERIRKLVSPHARPGVSRPAPADLPTYRNIVRELQALGRRAAPGEQVLVHYSGHGGRLQTVVPEIKGEAGWDECLVPCDAAESHGEGGFLRDIELHALVRDLAEKGIQVTLLLDSCHSGGAFRGGDSEKTEGGVRSIGQIRGAGGQGPARGGSWNELAGLCSAAPKVAHRDLKVLSGWFPPPVGCSLLAACRPNELAREYSFDGAGTSGALTHFLLETARLAGSQPNLRDLHRRILAKIHTWCRDQTPVLEGDGDLGLGHREATRAAAGVTVLECRGTPTERVLLGVGWIHGIGAGARFVVTSSRTPSAGSQEAAPLEVEIESPGPATSWARVNGKGKSQVIEPGQRAVLVDPGPWIPRCTVGWAVDELDVRKRPFLARFHEALTGDASPFLVAVKDGDRTDFSIGLDASCRARVLNAVGSVVPRQGPALSLDEPAAIDRLVVLLEHLARYEQVRKLTRLEASSPLRGRLRAELFRVPPGAFPGDRFCRRGCDGPVACGEHLHLVVHNGSELALNLAVLDLQPDWGIAQVHPPREVADFELLDAGGESVAALAAHLPEGILSGRDILLVFAADEPLDLSSLELEPLEPDEPASAAGLVELTATRSLGASGGALATPAPASTRSVRPSTPGIGAWTVLAVELEVVAEAPHRALAAVRAPASRTFPGRPS